MTLIHTVIQAANPWSAADAVHQVCHVTRMMPQHANLGSDELLNIHEAM